MRTPSKIVYEACGRPTTDKKTEITSGMCALCGGAINNEPAVHISKAFGIDYTERQYLAVNHSDYVCLGCIFSMSGRPGGKITPIRMFSLLWIDGKHNWANFEGAPLSDGSLFIGNKANLMPIIETLINPPAVQWFCSVADSGKCHTLVNTPINYNPIRIGLRYERSDIRMLTSRFQSLVGHVLDLYLAGFVRAEILACNPSPSRVAKIGLDVYEKHFVPVRYYFDSPFLSLACFFLRKEGMNELRNKLREATGERESSEPVANTRTGDTLDNRCDEKRIDRQDTSGRLVAEGKVGAGCKRQKSEQLSLFG